MTSKALEALLTRASQRPDGYSNHEMAAEVAGRWSLETIRSVTHAINRDGVVHSAKHGRNVRYFDTSQRAANYFPPLPAKPAPKKRGIVKARGASISIKPPAGGPARMPGDPVITEHTKFTIAKPPPERMPKSNTWSQL